MSTVRNENMNENMLRYSSTEFKSCWHSWKPEWERFDNCCNNDQEMVNPEEEAVYHSITQDGGSVNADDVECLDANKDE